MTTLGVGIDDPPVDAVAVHGTGIDHLRDLRRAETLQWLVRVLAAPDALRRHGVEDAIAEQTEALAHWLARFPPDELGALLDEPGLRIWAMDLVTGADRRGTRSLTRHATALPLLLAAYLGPGAPAGPFVTTVPATRRFAPPGWTWRPRPRGTLLVEATLTADGNQVALTTSDGELRLDRRTGARAGLSHHPRLGVEARVFVDGAIEVLDADAYPELSGARSPDERPSDLPPDDLAAVLARAFGFLDRYWPAAVVDVRSWFRGVIAITAPGTHVYSASAVALPLIVKLTARPDESPSLLAETLVHETAHGKLESLWDMSPLLANDDAELVHHHPWRPDPRPLRAVFLAAHAFANVMLLYRNALARGWSDATVPCEILERQVTTALDTLERHASFTPTGAAVFERLRHIV